MIQSVWKNLTGLQKDKSWSQLNTSGVTLNADLEPKIPHQTQMTYGYIHYMDKSIGTLSLEQKMPFQNCDNKDRNIIIYKKNNYFHLFNSFGSV